MKAGWQVTKLGEVCEIIMGQSPDGESYNTTGEGVPLINGPVEFSKGSFGNTVKTKFTTQPTKFCKTGDLILCVRGSTTGKMNIAGFDACIGRGVAAIRAKQYQPWINHFISSKRDEIHGRGTGATFPNVSGAMVADFEICMPPIPEQQRIVTLLDEAFDGIATAKAHAEKNLQNARAIFESHLQSVFTQRGDGWVSTTIGESCTLKSGTTVPVSIEKSSGDIPYVKVAEMTLPDNQDGITTSIRFLDRPDVKPGWLIPKGAVIFPKRGGAILTNKKRLALVDMCADLNIMSVIPSKNITPEFLYFYFLTVDMRKLGTGSSIPQINNYDIAPLEISFPKSATKQTEIADSIRSLESECQALESIYQQKLTALDELKKSLLHRAFNGDL